MQPAARTLILISLLSPLSAHAIRPRCQIQGQVKDAKGKSIAAIGLDNGKELVVAKTEPDQSGHYRIDFGMSDRLSYEKLRVRLLDSKGKVLKELELGKPDEGKDCANTIDF